MEPNRTLRERGGAQKKKHKKNNTLSKLAAVADNELDRALTIDANIAKPAAALRVESSSPTPNKFSWAEAVVYGEVASTSDIKLRTKSNEGSNSKDQNLGCRTETDVNASVAEEKARSVVYKFDDLDFPPVGGTSAKSTPKKLQATVPTKESSNQIVKPTPSKSCDKKLADKSVSMPGNKPKPDPKFIYDCFFDSTRSIKMKPAGSRRLRQCLPSTSAASDSTNESRSQLTSERQRLKAGLDCSDKSPTQAATEGSPCKPLSSLTRNSPEPKMFSSSNSAQRETYAQIMQKSLPPAATKAPAKDKTDQQLIMSLDKCQQTEHFERSLKERTVESRISSIAMQFDAGVDKLIDDDDIPPSGTSERGSMRKRRRKRRSKRHFTDLETMEVSPYNIQIQKQHRPNSDDLHEFPPLPNHDSQIKLEMPMRHVAKETLKASGDNRLICQDVVRDKPRAFEETDDFIPAGDQDINSDDYDIQIFENYNFLQSPDEDDQIAVADVALIIEDHRVETETEMKVNTDVNQTKSSPVWKTQSNDINMIEFVSNELKSSEEIVCANEFEHQFCSSTNYIADLANSSSSRHAVNVTELAQHDYEQSVGCSLNVNVNESIPIELNNQTGQRKTRRSRRKRRKPRWRNVLLRNAALNSAQVGATTPQEAPINAAMPAPQTSLNPIPLATYTQSNYIYVTPSQAQTNSNQPQVAFIVHGAYYQQQPQQYQQFQPFFEQQQQQNIYQFQYPQQQQHPPPPSQQQQQQQQYALSQTMPVYGVSSVMQTSSNATNSMLVPVMSQPPIQPLQYVIAQSHILQNPPNVNAVTPIYTQQLPIALGAQMLLPLPTSTPDWNISMPTTATSISVSNNTDDMTQMSDGMNSCQINSTSSSTFVQSPIFTMSTQSSNFVQLETDWVRRQREHDQLQLQQQQQQQHQQQEPQLVQQQSMTQSVFSSTPPAYRPKINNAKSNKKARQRQKSVYSQAASAELQMTLMTDAPSTTTTTTINENNLLQRFEPAERFQSIEGQQQQQHQQDQTEEDEPEENLSILSESQRATLETRSYVVQSQAAIMKRRLAQSRLHAQSPELAFYSQMAPYLKNFRTDWTFKSIYRPVENPDTCFSLGILPPSIRKLYDIVTPRYSEYSFVYALSAQLCQDRVPMDSYIYFKMSLLLSLASFEDKPESNRPPVSLMVICYDTYMANYLLNTVGELARRFVGPNDETRPPVQVNTAKFTWNEANPVMLAQGGVYYAGNWKRVKTPSADALLNFVENSIVHSERSEKDYPLETAIWSHWHPEDGPDTETFQKFFKVFGLPIFMEDDINEVMMNYILHQFRVQVFESSDDFLSIPLEEMREFLATIAKRSVSYTTEATNLLQKYFVVTRVLRPNVLSKQTYVVLKQFAESFAKLSLRFEVYEIDVVSAIFLCETFLQHIYGRSEIPPPDFVTFNYIAMVDSYMNVFYNWLLIYLKSAMPKNNGNDDSDDNMLHINDLFDDEDEVQQRSN